jgi:hypothetical protein
MRKTGIILVALMIGFVLGTGAWGVTGNIKDNAKSKATDEWFPQWMDKHSQPSKEEIEKLKKDKGFPIVIIMLQTFLWEQGYFGDIPISGNLDERTKQAIQKYQKHRGLEVTGDINAETFEKIFSDMKVVNTPIIDIGIGHNLFTKFWDSYITASGTWVFEDGTEQGMPLQKSKIVCSRDKGICSVATTRVGVGGQLQVDNDIYEIERWDNNELVTKPLDFMCVRYVLRINRLQKTVKLFRTTISYEDTCKGVEKRDYTLKLVDSFEVWNKINNKKKETLKKIMLFNPSPGER